MISLPPGRGRRRIQLLCDLGQQSVTTWAARARSAASLQSLATSARAATRAEIEEDGYRATPGCVCAFVMIQIQVSLCRSGSRDKLRASSLAPRAVSFIPLFDGPSSWSRRIARRFAADTLMGLAHA